MREGAIFGRVSFLFIFPKKLKIGIKLVTASSISKDLKKRGFKFVGSTIIYAYMQGIGMVNDHAHDCAWRNPTSAVK